MNAPATPDTARLRASGLGHSAIAEWRAEFIDETGDYDSDCARYSLFWGRSNDLLQRLPPKPKRNDAEAEAAATILAAAREHRERFLTAHAATVYGKVTRGRTRFVRLDALVFEAAATVPGLVPTRDELAAESACPQRDKEGIEIDQGLFLAHVLGDETAGGHLCHAMLLPGPQAAELLPKLAAEGAVDLGKVSVERKGKASLVTMKNPRFLNAEDESTFEAMEIAVDLALSIRQPKSQYCAGASSTIRDIADGAFSAAASISLTSTAAGSHSFGCCGAISASFTSSCAASRGRRRCPTTCTVMASKSPGSRPSTAPPSAAIAKSC
jgi:thioesterase DpgC